MILDTNAPTAADVFAVFHFIIEANHDLTAHEVWILAHQIVYELTN